ncbi:MAG: hypothetical protein LIO78_03105 [Clostridiales bacterium]|nr:hypothetical protein [Clostridiales bacterium]MCC8099039.1 hypothetical protein [Clostridiales bacterium]
MKLNWWALFCHRPRVRDLQNRIVRTYGVKHFNSQNHDTTLTNVAAGKGVCIAAGFLNVFSGEFAWTPVDCEEHMSCVLCAHAGDNRKSVATFLGILLKLYQE